MEAEARAKSPNLPSFQTVSERDKVDRDRQAGSRQKELPRVWSSERDDLLASQPISEYESKLKKTDRSNPSSTQRRKPQKSIDVQAGAEGDTFHNDFDPIKGEGYMSVPVSAYQSNSFNTTDLDHTDNPDDPDYRGGQGSAKNTSRTLNAAKYVFTRDAKSRSNTNKSSRSANTKLSAGPAIASIKKFLQNSNTKTPNSSNNSFTKSFEEAPSIKTLAFPGGGDPRGPPSEQQAAFKKPSKDFLFTRSGKAGGPFSGYGGSPPEERGNSSRGDN